jgi:ribosome biogenesis protein Nip4
MINQNQRERPIVAAIHPKLVEELKLRQVSMENATDRKTRGGMTTFSEQAAHELELIRLSGDKIVKEIFKVKDIKVTKFLVNGVEMDFIPYETFKKLYIFSSILAKKKDCQQIKVEVAKIKGLQKNEVTMFW